MRALAILIGSIVVVIAPHACNAQWIDDPFNDYLQRSVTISMGAGNANDTNAAIHTINPWPPYAGNTRIHTTGRQGVDSIERMYRVPNPFERDGAANAQGGGTTGLGGDGGASGTSPTGAPVTPMQPITSGY
jgi:hypothetical protein